MEAIAQYFTESTWWELSLMAIGAIAFVSVITRLFSSIGNRSRILHVTGNPAVSTREFMISLAGLVGRTPAEGGRIEVLQNGDEFLPRFLDDLHQARKHIHITNYIWSDGEMLGKICAILCEKASQGVEVRLLLDSYGALDVSKETLNTLEQCGVAIVRFRPFIFGKLTRYHRRTHRRAFVIDGMIGYTGGIAFDDRWLGAGREQDRWRDTMFRMTGAMVHEVQGSFAQLWAATRGEILAGAEMYPPIEDTRDVRAENREESRPFSYVHLSSSPTEDTQPIDKFLWLVMNAARRTLYITNYIFIVDKAIRRALIERAIAGVDVRILLPGILDAKFARFASHSYYDDLLKAGVRFYEFQPAMLHSKTIVVDGMLSVIGSVNLDVRSKKWNEEIAFAIQDRGLATELIETFLHDLKLSREIRSDEWKNRGYLKRGVEHLSVLFSEQF